ncbi:MAG: AAA family ATPase [Thermoplasmata archaeon]|nr:AAA family ATPase [Thermoplasmata archaeon]
MAADGPPTPPAWTGFEGDPALVGRDSEISQLTTLVGEAVDGAGGVVMIHGEAGIGKTRLLSEIRARATVDGVQCLAGLCQERDQGVPYAPWIEIIRELVKRSSKELLYRVLGTSRPAVLRLLPELSERVWLHDPEVAGAGELNAREFLDAIVRMFVTLSEDHPALIVLDDLGWADAGTLELLTTLGKSCRGHRIAVVAAYRDAHKESNRALDRALEELERARLAIDLSPKPLDRVQVDQLIRSAWKGRDVGRGFRGVVWRRSGGNPFFAVEILRSLDDSTDLAAEWEPGDTAAEARLRIPAGIRGVISQRLDRLDDPTRRALRVASLLGLEFSFELLEAVSKLEEEPLLTSLEQALRLRLIAVARSTPGGATYAFAHPLIQEVLAGEVGPDRSRRVHLRAARALEAKAHDGDDLAASLAYHYLRANDGPMALRHSILAGDRAARLFARTDAVAHYRTALALLAEHPDPPTSAQVLNALSVQLTILGDYAAAVKCLIEAAKLEEGLGNLVRAGSLMAQAAHTVWTPREFRPKEVQLQQARSLLEGTSPSSELAQLYLDHANLIAKWGRLDEARTLLARSLEAATTIGDRSAEGAVHLALAQIVALGGRAEVHRELQTALELTREESPEMALRTYHFLALLSAYGYADLEEAARWVDEAVRSSAGREASALLATIRGGVGCFVALMRGDLDEARRGSVDYAEFLRTHGQPPSAHNLMMVGALATLAGDLQEATRALDQAKVTFSIEDGWFPDLWLGVFIARLELARGEPARAAAELVQCLVVLRHRGWVELDGSVGIFYYSGLVEASLGTGDLDRARSHLAELVQLSAVIGGTPALAFACRAEGQVAAAEGRNDAAAQWFRRSIPMWTEAGWKLELARELASLAELLARHGDRSESEKLRAQAVALCEAAGSRLDLARIRPDTANPVGKPARPSPAPAGRPARSPRRKNQVPGDRGGTV